MEGIPSLDLFDYVVRLSYRRMVRLIIMPVESKLRGGPRRIMTGMKGARERPSERLLREAMRIYFKGSLL